MSSAAALIQRDAAAAAAAAAERRAVPPATSPPAELPTDAPGGSRPASPDPVQPPAVVIDSPLLSYLLPGDLRVFVMAVDKPAVVRSERELGSKKVGEIPPGTLMHVHESRDMPDGSRRA